MAGAMRRHYDRVSNSTAAALSPFRTIERCRARPELVGGVVRWSVPTADALQTNGYHTIFSLSFILLHIT